LIHLADISTVLEEKDGNCDSPITDNSTTEDGHVDSGDTSSQKNDSSATQEPVSSGKIKAGLEKKKRITKLEKVEKAMEKVCDTRSSRE